MYVLIFRLHRLTKAVGPLLNIMLFVVIIAQRKYKIEIKTFLNSFFLGEDFKGLC